MKLKLDNMRLKIVVVLVILGLGWWLVPKIFNKKAATPQYQTAAVEKGTLVISVTASGQVPATNSKAVTTAATGVVKKTYVQNGQKVNSGQAMLEIDLDMNSRANYLQALSSYQSASANLYSLQNTLFTTNQKLINDAVARGLSSADPTYIEENALWLAAEAAYKNQQNSISAARMAMWAASPIVYAPITGTVSGMSVQEGTVVTSQNIASLITSATPVISVNLTEVDAPKVKLDDKATVTFDSITGKTYTGRVISVDKVGIVSSNVTSYPAVIKLDTASDEILPNMSAQVSIITQTKDNVLLVPAGAVQNQTVSIMKNGKVTTADVETGLTSGTQVEIVSGLTEGETVVTGTTSTPAQRSSTPTQSVFGGIGGGGARGFGR